MAARILRVAAIAALGLAGCSGATATSSATSSSSTGGPAGTGALNGAAGKSSGSGGAASAQTTSSGGMPATSATAGSTSPIGGALGSTSPASAAGSTGATGNCIGAGQFSPGGASACCSGMVDSGGFCTSPGNGGITGSTGSGNGPSATAGSSTTAATFGGQASGNASSGAASTTIGGVGSSGTTGTVCTNGLLFCGGWSPPDSGYEPVLTGDAGTIIVVDTTAPSNPTTLFGGSSSGPSIAIAYPPDGVLIPPNMNSMDIQFAPGAGQTAFALTFSAPGATLVAYTGCKPIGGGCHYQLPTAFWETVVNYSRGATPITWSIQGVNGTTPGAVGTSASQSIAVSDQDITGGIYYWNDEGNIQRYDWGLPNTQAETWLQPALGQECISCHVMDRVGDLAAADYSAPTPAGSYYIYAVATATPLQVNGKKEGGAANFFSFSPDGNLLLASNGAKITMRDVTTASTPAVVVPNGTMPDWSPSGLDMVYAAPKSSFLGGLGGPMVDSASIDVAHYNGTTWTAGTTLVPFDNANKYYPAYAPTGDWVVYIDSPANNDSFANAPGQQDAGTPDGELWAVASGGGSPIRLDAATDPGATSWPKWAPVVNDYYGGKVMWLTFTTGRPYGLYLGDNERAQLWMVAFDPAKAAAGGDPSFPAFYLPFQSIDSGNHIAQWVTTVVRRGCTQDSQCETGDICQAGECIPRPVTHDPVKPRRLGAWVRDQLDSDRVVEAGRPQQSLLAGGR